MQDFLDKKTVRCPHCQHDVHLQDKDGNPADKLNDIDDYLNKTFRQLR